MIDAGLIVLTSFISPFRSERRMARELVEAGEFFEIYVDTPLEVAEHAIPRACTKRRGAASSPTSPASTAPTSRPRRQTW